MLSLTLEPVIEAGRRRGTQSPRSGDAQGRPGYPESVPRRPEPLRGSGWIMPNERLRRSIAGAGLTVDRVAEIVGVDPKTVERWISKNRLPHRVHRRATSELLKADESYLWPALLDRSRQESTSLAEFVALYPHRGAVP